MSETEKTPPEYKESQAPEEPIQTQPVQQQFTEQVVTEQVVPVRQYTGTLSLCENFGKDLGLCDCSCGSYCSYCWLSVFCVWIAGCCINNKIRWGNCTNALFTVAFVIQVTTTALWLAALIMSVNHCKRVSYGWGCYDDYYYAVQTLWIISR